MSLSGKQDDAASVTKITPAEERAERLSPEPPRRRSEAAAAIVAFGLALGLLGCWLALQTVVGA